MRSQSDVDVHNVGERFDVLPFFRPGNVNLSCFLVSLFIYDDVTMVVELPRIVREFPDVFHKDLSGLPPIREIEFYLILFLRHNLFKLLFIAWPLRS